MALDTFIAGAYSSTYEAVATGITEDGFELEQQTMAEQVGPTDVYGDSIIDLIHRGGNCYLTATYLPYVAGTRDAFYPWGSLGVLSTAAAPIGRLGSNVGAALILTATANTPAASTPASLTASLAILAPNSNLRLLFSSKLRKVPMRMLLLPYSSTNIIWFTTTAVMAAVSLWGMVSSGLGSLIGLA